MHTPENDVVTISVEGRLDSLHAGQLGDALQIEMNKGNVDIILVLEDVKYISSAGIREIVRGYKAVKRLNGNLRVVKPSPIVREVFEIIGLDTILIVPDDNIIQ